MKDKFFDQVSNWLDARGPHSGVVLSTRIRLARNLKNHRFVHFTKSPDKSRIFQTIIKAGQVCTKLKNPIVFNLKNLNSLQRHMLVERHIISHDMENEQGDRGVILTKDERMCVMINKEDHLRIQCIFSGFQPLKAWEEINKLDDEMAKNLDYAFLPQFGYLTACPTNVGTGIRISVLMHLPALVLTKNIEKTLKGIAQVGLNIRGFYGEGTDVLGNLFQISNQTTLGKSEMEIIETLSRVIEQLIEIEQEGYQRLLHDARTSIEDKIWRAYGIMKNARLLTSSEFMSLSSALRLGIQLGICKEIDVQTLNEMLLLVQPSHLQNAQGQKMGPAERDRIRADMVRKLLESK
jgi:protein arginine kinase